MNSTKIAIMVVIFVFILLTNLLSRSEEQESEFKTLKLVRHYPTPEELYERYPVLRPKSMIIDTKKTITFVNPNTGAKVKHIVKENSRPPRDEERQTWSYSYVPEAMMHGVWYHITRDGEWLLQTEYLIDAQERPETEQPDVDIKRQVLYNSQGEQITTLPFHIEFLITSPTKHYFVAYRLGGYEVPEIYFVGFFSSDGTLLNTYEAGGKYLNIAYSQNGEFIILSNSPRVIIFTKTGEIVYQQEDARHMIHETWDQFYTVCVSEDGKSMLLQGVKNIYFYTFNEKLLWEQPSSYSIAKCYFMPEKKLLITERNTGFYPPQQDEEPRFVRRSMLQILSLETGEILDEIPNMNEMHIIDHHLIIEQQGQYSDYSIMTE